MFDIKKYLEKFKIIHNTQNFLKNSIAESIKDVCNIDIQPSKIKINGYIARIDERPIIKTEIFLKKIHILNILNKKTNKKITDIL